MQKMFKDKDKFCLADYLMLLESKGFKFQEDTISFIYFGKQSTAAEDFLVALTIELTLKTQKRFDGSFYLSLLETLTEKRIETRKQAYMLMKQLGMLKGTETDLP